MANLVTQEYVELIARKLKEYTSNLVQTYTPEKTLTLSSWDLVDDIGIGYNIGNSLDSVIPYESDKATFTVEAVEKYWGCPLITKVFIDKVKAAGFNAIRLPVTWMNLIDLTDPELKIRADLLARVKTVVDYIIGNDMYCILNSHHDRLLFWAATADINTITSNIVKVWGQIANYFGNYNEKLIFEAYNEILTKNENWSGTSDGFAATNQIAQAFVTFIRSTGGKNRYRNLMVNTYAASGSSDMINPFVLPIDEVSDRLIVSVHDYTTTMDQGVEIGLSRWKNAFNGKAPVIIGEWGIETTQMSGKNRELHARNFIARAKKYGIKCFWWDSGHTGIDKVCLSWGILDRTTGEPIFPYVIDGMKNGLTWTPVDTTNKTTTDLTNMSLWERTELLETGLTKADTTSYYTTVNYIPVSPYSVYTMTIYHYQNGFPVRRACFYDENHNFLYSTPLVQTLKFRTTAPEGARYMKFTINNPWGSYSITQMQSLITNGQLTMSYVEQLYETKTYEKLNAISMPITNNWRNGKFYISDASYRSSDVGICLNDYKMCDFSSVYTVSLNNSNYIVNIQTVTIDEIMLTYNMNLGNGRYIFTRPSSYFMAISVSDKNNVESSSSILSKISDGTLAVSIQKLALNGSVKYITIDYSTFTGGKQINGSNGSIVNHSNGEMTYGVSDFIEIPNRGIDYITFSSTYGGKRIAQYDANKAFISYTGDYIGISGDITLNSLTRYIRIESTWIMSGAIELAYFRLN